MRLVMLTGEGPEHRYVASVLAEQFPDDLKAIVVAPPPGQVWAGTTRYLKKYTPVQICSRVLDICYLAMTRQAVHRQQALERQLLADGQVVTTPSRRLLRAVPSHNGTECEALLKDVLPDILLVYGTTIIKPHIFSLARVLALNLHTGIAPRYRGADTIFWPLYNEEPEWVGVTVHVLDEGVDSGPVIFTGRPEIDPRDDEDHLFAKSTIVGAGLYVEAIRRVMAGTAEWRPQQIATGCQYRFVDRSVFAEMRVRRLLQDGLLARFARQTAACEALGPGSE